MVDHVSVAWLHLNTGDISVCREAGGDHKASILVSALRTHLVSGGRLGDHIGKPHSPTWRVGRWLGCLGEVTLWRSPGGPIIQSLDLGRSQGSVIGELTVGNRLPGWHVLLGNGSGKGWGLGPRILIAHQVERRNFSLVVARRTFGVKNWGNVLGEGRHRLLGRMLLLGRRSWHHSQADHGATASQRRVFEQVHFEFGNTIKHPTGGPAAGFGFLWASTSSSAFARSWDVGVGRCCPRDR